MVLHVFAWQRNKANFNLRAPKCITEGWTAFSTDRSTVSREQSKLAGRMNRVQPFSFKFPGYIYFYSIIIEPF